MYGTDKSFAKDSKGFTLVEIIVALVILGILVAVAATKYMDLIYQAETRTLEGALGAGLSEVALQYSRLSLSNGVPPTVETLASAVTANPPGSDEYAFSFEPVLPNSLRITAWRVKNPSHQKIYIWSAP